MLSASAVVWQPRVGMRQGSTSAMISRRSALRALSTSSMLQSALAIRLPLSWIVRKILPAPDQML